MRAGRAEGRRIWAPRSTPQLGAPFREPQGSEPALGLPPALTGGLSSVCSGRLGGAALSRRGLAWYATVRQNRSLSREPADGT